MSGKIMVTAPIIVVEDDVDDQFLLSKIFERIGVESEIIFFPDGEAAYAFLKSTDREIFLILCDINMPVMNGLEFRAKIRKDESLRNKGIPFVFLSTAARQNDVATAFELAAQGFFVKKSTMSEMETSMRTILTYWAISRHAGSGLRQIY